METICTSDGCHALVLEVNKSADAIDARLAAGTDNPIDFHASLKDLDLKIKLLIAQLQKDSGASAPPAALDFPLPNVPQVVNTRHEVVDLCGQCDQLFNTFTGICAVYNIVSSVAFGICEGVVVDQYVNCLSNYCC